MTLARWLTPWLRKVPATALPLGLTEQQISALKTLRSTPHWQHYAAALARLAEQQAAELASGLPHERYLFASGALTALRRVYTLVDDLIATATKLEEITDARASADARHTQRAASTFVNTPWYDGWRNATGPDSVARGR